MNYFKLESSAYTKFLDVPENGSFFSLESKDYKKFDKGIEV